MMKRVGYLEKGREPACDLNGKTWDIVELHIGQMRLAIRVADLRGALAGRICARVEHLERSWGLRLTGICGLARANGSGRALNIEMNDGNAFTVSLDMVRAVMARKERYASVAEIPAFSTVPEIRGSGSTVQQRLNAGYA